MHGRKALAGIIVVAAVIAATFISALSAQAVKKHYEGSVAHGQGEIEFDLKRKHGKAKIKNVVLSVPWNCSYGTSVDSFNIKRGEKVTDRRFQIRKEDPDAGSGRTHQVVDVAGQLQKRGRASGTLHALLSYDLLAICDSGTLKWSATR